MKNLLSLMAAFLILLISLGSCEEENDNNETAPSLPPEASFVMPFDAFSSTSGDMKTSELQGNVNWVTAATQVTVWNVFISIGMAIPTIAFLEAFNHEAVYDVETNKWLWSYNVPHHTVVLSGKVESDSVYWEMQLSKADVFSDFVWYTGTSHINGSGGYWIINENPEETSPLLRIDWNRDSSNETGDIKYTNVQPGGAENGGYIHYGSNTDTDYNRYYNIFNKGQDNLTEIKWNNETHNGRIKNPAAFKDEIWHCWGTDLVDMDCE